MLTIAGADTSVGSITIVIRAISIAVDETAYAKAKTAIQDAINAFNLANPKTVLYVDLLATQYVAQG